MIENDPGKKTPFFVIMEEVHLSHSQASVPEDRPFQRKFSTF